MGILNSDRETTLNIIAMIMATIFCLDVIMLVLAIKLRREEKRDSKFYNIIQFFSLAMGALSILISIVYWCILR
ncbi:hypothetical protein RBQ61_02770 [Sedimentibacter sp. MB35-C1]|uniref:hypothetical protein n=1 Tax=Sedimentibacter sp. MB35-C1 TaxID=3070995 RepID=UPI0027DFF5EF|nr:hypothetical protein [Sedimentibacter sp. MB35-C1]WMJ77868.1 hypothetical protein RBQ61_02770 [Sedimentibacter sp. MB35-C1]